MANLGYIIVPSGLQPVHSFDLYGPLVDSVALSEQSINLFELIAREEGIAPELAAKIAGDYRALSRGEPWTTGGLKNGIIDALHKPLENHPELQPDYKATFQEDGLYVLREILGAGEGVLVFSSKYPEWLKESLREDLAEKVTVYGDRKTKPEAFQRVYDAETAKGRRVVTHTADELPELEAAVQSGLFSNGKGRVIFVNRNNQISEEVARSHGIDAYVDNLKDVGYSRLVKKRHTVTT